MGANLVGGGATFRVWAPAARAVFVNGRFDGVDHFSKDTDDSLLLVNDGNGFWAGFIPGVQEGDRYKFFVVGQGVPGFKRDPYARELTTPQDFPGTHEFPACDCVVRDPNKYQWRSQHFRPAAFNDLIIYQLHVGTFFGPQRDQGRGNFLDVAQKIDHLVRLGINAVEPLPIDEAGSDPSRGYDGRDFFSPEMVYGVPVADLDPYIAQINALFAAKGVPGVTKADLMGSMAQLKVMVDVLHLYGIGVIFDVVYNHAGPFNGDDESIYFFDLLAKPGTSNNNDSQYFTDFMQELVRVRLRHPALRGETCNAFIHQSQDRILAYHRWMEGIGRDVVVVVSLNETTFNSPNYRIGFPQPGRWLEVFNSDVYDDFGQRRPFGNDGSIVADSPPMDGFPYSAGVVIPANSILVFARDAGD